MDIDTNKLIEKINYNQKESKQKRRTFKQIFHVNKKSIKCTKFNKTFCDCGCIKKIVLYNII